MNGTEDFFDTTVVLYLLSADTAKADRAEDLLALGGTISVQVLNEFVAVASRKLRMSLMEIREVLTQIRAVCPVEPRKNALPFGSMNAAPSSNPYGS